MKKITLAIIDNYPLIREAVCFSFKKMGFEVAFASSYDKMTIATLATRTIHVCCLNITSFEVQDTALDIKAVIPGIKIIGYAIDNAATNGTIQGFDLFLLKSDSEKRIKKTVERLCLDAIDSG